MTTKYHPCKVCGAATRASVGYCKEHRADGPGLEAVRSAARAASAAWRAANPEKEKAADAAWRAKQKKERATEGETK